ncbi:hypothetical protein KTQ42_04895|uniref:hypothetical protein n=1 Tax=Noviherbaspirillum sp. L7-7A TaxID=2850560 RepID=UPI001C2BC14F|nr:hypothetical protein [Noviherbaspirillum sp. L7-7A]MBV0878638.1 hypothetical protein [Noviherbaspirillum sp. L7-7A]
MALAANVSRHDAYRDSLPAISIDAPSEPPAPGQRHFVAVVRPREEDTARNLADYCFRLGLSWRTVYSDDKDFRKTVSQLHADGEIGALTNVILLGHSDSVGGQHRIQTRWSERDQDNYLYPVMSDTLKFARSLRKLPETGPAAGKRMRWKGMIDVPSCAAEILGKQVAASAEVQAEGPNMLYGDLDCHGCSESSHAIRSICEFVHQPGTEKPFSAAAMLAWVSRTAAVPVTLAGGGVGAPIVVLPAQSLVEAMHAFLPARLRQVQVEEAYDAVRAAVAQASLGRVSSAMRQEAGRPDSLLLQRNLARIIHDQLIHDCLGRAAEPFADVPPLLRTITAFGEPLDIAVEIDSLHRYEKLARNASNNCHRAAKHQPDRSGKTALHHAGFATLADAAYWQTLTAAGEPLAGKRPAQAPRSSGRKHCGRTSFCEVAGRMTGPRGMDWMQALTL